MRPAIPTILLTLAAAACSQGNSAPADEALRQDLELIGGGAGGLTLAPGSGTGAKTVSSLEQLGTPPRQLAPAPSAPRHEASPVPESQAPEATDPTPQPAAEPPVEPPAVTPAPIPTRRPQPATPSRGGNGGYKTVEEVIRDAPFPINP